MFTKKCPYCKKQYQTESRNQKFCCSEHGKKYNDRLKNNRKFQDENKELFRIKSRSHSLAVEILKFKAFQSGLDIQCEFCGNQDRLEAHHKDFNFLNNSPDNLIYLCNKCHSKEHSKEKAEQVKVNTSFIDFVKDIQN